MDSRIEEERAKVQGPRTVWFDKPEAGAQLPARQVMGEIVGEDGQAYPVATAGAFQAHTGVRETADPMTRSYALLVRNVIPLVFTGILAFAGSVFAGIWWMGFIAWPIFSLLWWTWQDRQERDYSTNGLELYRVRAATQVRLDENAKSHELRKIALDGYLRHLEGRQGQ
jgi:hypothetical protein